MLDLLPCLKYEISFAGVSDANVLTVIHLGPRKRVFLWRAVCLHSHPWVGGAFELTREVGESHLRRLKASLSGQG